MDICYDLLIDISMYLSSKELYCLSSTKKSYNKLVWYLNNLKAICGQRILNFRYIKSLRISSYHDCELDVSLLTALTELNIGYRVTVKGYNNLTKLSLYTDEKVQCIPLTLTSLSLGMHQKVYNLDHLTNLTYLDLSINQYVRDITKLTSLKTLKLLANYQIENIATLTQLTELDLTCNCRVESIPSLLQLRKLNLCSNKVILSIPYLPKLEELNLMHNKVINDISHLTNLKKVIRYNDEGIKLPAGITVYND